MKNIIKRFDSPDETRIFEKGKFEIIKLEEMTIGRASYEPGWIWSKHVGEKIGEKLCNVGHIGMVVSGKAMVLMEGGTEIIMKAGDVFSIIPGHDSWVIGDEPYVSLHFMGADEYAAK